MINPEAFAIGERQIKSGQRFRTAETNFLKGLGNLGGKGSFRISHKHARAIKQFSSYTSK
jgi:hypothetical protein